MAKLSSKYFASVITKLLAAKRRENIVINEQFKSDLRAGLMLRAGNMDVVAEKGSRLDFLVRWRYALALVPSAMLLMLVVSQFLKMPVAIESEVMVPTGGGTVTEEGKGAESEGLTPGAPGTPGVLGDMAGDFNSSTKKIKTFSGADIFPGGVPDATSDERTLGGAVPSEVSVTKTTGEVIKYVPPYNVDEGNISSTTADFGGGVAQDEDRPTELSTADMVVPSLVYPYYEYYVNGVKRDNGTVLDNDVRVTGGGSNKDYSADLTGDEGASTAGGESSGGTDGTSGDGQSLLGDNQGGVDTTGEVASGDGMGGGMDTGTEDLATGSGDFGATVPYSQTLNPVLINDGTVVLLPKIPTPIQPGTIPTTDFDTSSSVPYINLLNLVPLNEAETKPAPSKAIEVLPIHYLTDLSVAAKADLEKQVIMPMVLRGGVGVAAVNVASMDQGVLAVTVCYFGDGCAVSYYLKNNGTGAFDHVQYVNKTFTTGPSYTTRLQYTKSN